MTIDHPVKPRLDDISLQRAIKAGETSDFDAPLAEQRFRVGRERRGDRCVKNRYGNFFRDG